LLNLESLELRFFPGWDDTIAIDQVLHQEQSKDLRYCFTHSGPHRADFQVYFNKRVARDYLSRGQLKLVILALMLAQVSFLNAQNPNACCLLIDDLAAELDSENRVKLIEYLAGLNSQIFITSTHLADFEHLAAFKNLKTFHVEQGCIKPS